MQPIFIHFTFKVSLSFTLIIMKANTVHLKKDCSPSFLLLPLCHLMLTASFQSMEG